MVVTVIVAHLYSPWQLGSRHPREATMATATEEQLRTSGPSSLLSGLPKGELAGPTKERPDACSLSLASGPQSLLEGSGIVCSEHLITDKEFEVHWARDLNRKTRGEMCEGGVLGIASGVVPPIKEAWSLVPAKVSSYPTVPGLQAKV
jgi:hypothetical protein